MTTEIRWRRGRHHGVEIETMDATIRLPGHDVRDEHVVIYMQGATRDGWDGLSINGTWFEDRNENDMFCSEMFAALTGKYPHEVRDEIPMSEW